MKSLRKPAIPAPVLRNVVLQELPHALARPRRPAPQAPEIERTLAPVIEVQPRFAAAVPDRYEEGFAEGYAQANAAAAAKIAEAQTAAQTALHSAIEEGRRSAGEQGRAEGLAQAREQAQEELDQLRARLEAETDAAVKEKLAQLDRLMQGLESQRQELAAAAEDDLVALAHEAICRILGSQAASPESITGLVRQLLAQREKHSKVRVHVHPADAQALRDQAVTGWSWVADENVQLGGVLLRSAEGHLDARLEVQLEELRRTLMSVRAERRSGPAQDAGGTQA